MSVAISTGVGLAIAGAAGAGGAIYAAHESSSAAKDAAATQASTAQKALDVTNQLLSISHIFVRRRQRCLPYAHCLARSLNGPVQVTTSDKIETDVVTRLCNVRMVLRQYASKKIKRLLEQRQGILMPPKCTVRVRKIVHRLA